jgi:teichuronic acid exporter
MSPAEASAEPVRVRASGALALVTAQAGLARIVLFLSNWVLALLLSQQTFGVSGLLTIISTLSWTFVGFGLDDVLLQRGSAMRLWASTVARMSLLISLAMAIILVVLAPALGRLFHEPRVIGPTLVMAAALPIAALSIVPATRLSMRMDFNFLVGWGVVDLLTTQALIIVLAYLKFGAYSFVLPLPVMMALRAIAFNLRAPGKATKVHLGPKTFAILRRGFMVTGTKLSNNFISQADYLVLGILTTTSQVGYYYFAFRLAAAPVRTIAQSLNTVLFPAMIALRADAARRTDAAVKAARLLSWVVSPFCYFQMAIANPLLHLLFRDKWAPSIAIVQLLSVGLAIEAIMAVTRAYLSASGKFHVSLRYSIFNGIGFFMTCVVGAKLDSAVGVACAVSIYYLATQPAIFLFLVDRRGQRLRDAFSIFILPTAGSAIAFGLGWAATQAVFVVHGALVAIAVVVVIGWAGYLALLAIFAPGVLRDLVGLVQGLVARTKARTALANAAS